MDFRLLQRHIIRPPDPFASQGGVYHAARTTAGRSRFHEGVDLLTVAQEHVFAPAVGRVVRPADPYEDKKDKILSGLWYEIVSGPYDGFRLKMLYLKPDLSLVGKLVVAGTRLGAAQSLQHLYKRMLDHIHVEVWNKSSVRINPTPFLFDPPRPGGLVIA
jgi:hypothetical protein